jgi:hypothetical protein
VCHTLIFAEAVSDSVISNGTGNIAVFQCNHSEEAMKNILEPSQSISEPVICNALDSEFESDITAPPSLKNSDSCNKSQGHNHIPDADDVSSQLSPPNSTTEDANSEPTVQAVANQSHYWLIRSLLLLVCGIIVRLLIVSQLGQRMIQVNQLLKCMREWTFCMLCDCDYDCVNDNDK